MHYGNDLYARALFLFNSAHPQSAEGLRENPPVVRPGQQLFIPPSRILEKEHAGALPERSESRQPAISSSSAGTRTYRVSRDGEMFLDIARRTGAKWEEIYLLNQQHDPKQRVPGGTLLRLPEGATVPAENQQ
jgi:hypothetical protein